jgi:SAM-dependent methyltransferase
VSDGSGDVRALVAWIIRRGAGAVLQESGSVPHNIFVGSIAESYDDDSREMFDPGVLEPAVGFLSDAAQGGRALEFGIGTGRVALPLSQRGIEVCGIDISGDMLRRLQSKPGSDDIEVTRGDFATARVPGVFSLVYLVFNAISNLTSQDEQVECFCNAAAHLGPLGRLVVELWIPDLRRFPPNAVALPFEVSRSRVGFDTIDTATQQLVSHHYVSINDRLRVFESPHRYVWPSELDLMARIAGLRLRERWAWWDRSAFTAESGGHISVWEQTP